MNAKFYTYRNLNLGRTFSVKHHGLLCERLYDASLVTNGRFQVSEAGRNRCLATKKRNVHAFIASDQLPRRVRGNAIPDLPLLHEISYNPYRAPTFVIKDTLQPITEAERIYLIDGKCYIPK